MANKKDWLKRSKGSQVYFDHKATFGQIGLRHFYISWWFGPYSKLVCFQMWRFRWNLYYENWNKLPKGYKETFTIL